MNGVNRRAFLGAAAALPLPLALPAFASASVVPGLPARIKTSCNLYSFNASLAKHSMSLEQVMDFCAALGFDAVDPTGYYFSTYPEAPPTAEMPPAELLRTRVRSAHSVAPSTRIAGAEELSWNRRPSNMPSATGAKRVAVLGKISYP